MRNSWIEERANKIKRGSVSTSVAATALARLDKEESDQGEIPYRIGRGGTNLGRAVHSVLQTVNLEDIFKWYCMKIPLNMRSMQLL